MGLAHQIADTLAVIAEVQRSRSGAAIAHLVEQAGQQHVVALAQGAIGVDQELGHDEQRDALHPGRCIRQLGQHHVHDVLRQRVVAAGDEDLVALDPVAAVAGRFGAGADIRQRGAGVGFGQGHGAEEATVDHRLQKALFLLLATEALDQVGCAHGQEGVGGAADVGRLEVGEAGLGQQGRQLHAAGLEVAGSVEEAGLEKSVHRRLHFGDQYRLAVFITRFVLVALAVVRGEVLLGDAAGGTQGGVEGFAIVFGKPFALGQALGIEHLIQFKSQIAGTEQGLGHGGLPVD